MQTQPSSQFRLREPEALPYFSHVHKRDDMLASISASSELCARELVSQANDRYVAGMDSPLSRNIEALRAANGWTQDQLASAVGAKQFQVSKWIRKGEQPSTGPMIKLAELAGVSVEEFQTINWSPQRVAAKPVRVLMPVTLPSSDRLTAMVRGLLTGVGLDPQLVEQHAETLAQRLPGALETVSAHLTSRPYDEENSYDAPAQPRATHQPLKQQ